MAGKKSDRNKKVAGTKVHQNKLEYSEKNPIRVKNRIFLVRGIPPDFPTKAGSIDGEGEVVDEAPLLHGLAEFLCVVGAKSTSSYPDLQGRGNMVLNVAQLCTPGQCHHPKNSRKIPCPC